MSAWGRRTVPDDDALEDISWSLENGHDFWSYVDSSPSYTYRRCAGDPRDPEHSCGRWDHQRDGGWCIAANSSLERCNTRVVPGTPFCGRHLERAWDALCATQARSERDLLKRHLDRMREDNQEARRALLVGQRLELALLWDAATAASRVGEQVYFYAVEHAVKIGRSVNPEKRVKTLSGTKAPEGLDLRSGHLLGTIPGGCKVEGEIHDKFRGHRLVGEWFELAPIRHDIEGLVADFASLEATA